MKNSLLFAALFSAFMMPAFAQVDNKEGVVTKGYVFNTG